MKRLIAGAVLTFSSAIANAYPDYIAKGYTNCVSCHYSPTGGGFANSYGTASQQALFPDVIAAPAIANVRQKADVTGYDDAGTAQLQWGFGADTRLMLTTMPSQQGSSSGASFFPMLLEIGGAVAFGKLVAYGALAPQEPWATDVGWKLFSREHWLQFRATDTFSVRVGRIVLPFGLKQPDHTAYTRTGMGFGYFNQSYAAEADYIGEHVNFSIAGFLCDPLQQPSGLRERGVVTSLTFNIDGRASIGASGYYGDTTFSRRSLGALFARVRLIESSYLMLEGDVQHRTDELASQAVTSVATFERLGWFIVESLDLYVEHGFRNEPSAIAGAGTLTQNRYIVGASWWVLPWVELAPQVHTEISPSSKAYTAVFFQFHAYY